MILDSGNRTEFTTGAVRDIQEGKGRFDLMPLEVIAHILDDKVIRCIYQYQESKKVMWLYEVLNQCMFFDSKEDMLLEVAVQFEEGAKKYGENNWQKGIPVNRYLDSAIRHYLKHCRGDTDERHDRAFVWNILCCIWTILNIEGVEQ